MSENQEIIEKAAKKGIKLKFSNYYKYVFQHFGEDDEFQVFTRYGGDSNDIYRHEVDADDEEVFDSDYKESWKSVRVVEKSSGKEAEFYNESW
jgi:hypothetical protein